MSEGIVVQVIGAVIDVEFSRENLPKVYDALSIEESGLVLEVQQQLGDGVVRTIALEDVRLMADAPAVALPRPLMTMPPVVVARAHPASNPVRRVPVSPIASSTCTRAACGTALRASHQHRAGRLVCSPRWFWRSGPSGALFSGTCSRNLV